VRHAHRMFGCRGQPGGLVSFFKRIKKGTKEIRPYPPPFASLRVPRVARQAGLLRNSRFALRQSSQKSPSLAALLGGGPRGPKSTPHPHPGLPLEGEGIKTTPQHLPPLPSGERDGERGTTARPRPQNPNPLLRRFGLTVKLG